MGTREDIGHMEKGLAYECPSCRSIKYDGNFINRAEIPEGVVVVPLIHSIECVRNFYGSSFLFEKRVLAVRNQEGEIKIPILKKFASCPNQNGS